MRDRMLRPIEPASIVHDQLQIVDARLNRRILLVPELQFHRAEIHWLLDDIWVGREFQSFVVDWAQKVSGVFFLFGVADLGAEESVLHVSHGVSGPSCFALPFV